MAAKKQTIWLSPTRLADWYNSGCPQRWKWGSEFEPVKTDDKLTPMERGTLVHSLLEGTVRLDASVDRLTASLHDRILAVKKSIVQETLVKEQMEQFELGSYSTGNGLIHVMWKRKLDAIVRLTNGSLAIVDYKTTGGNGWRTVDGVAPQALGLQSMGYLIPPKKLPAPLRKLKWPTTVLYMVCGFRGPAQVHRVDYSEEAMADFHALVGMAVRAMAPKVFPKFPSKRCLADPEKDGCPFAAMCYKVEGWEGQYKKKERYNG